VLNFSVISSMDYRPQDNVLLVGTHGNGMFYTSAGTPDAGTPAAGDLFIAKIFPTHATNNVIRYTVGNTFDVQSVVVQVFSSSGQLLMSRQDAYRSNAVSLVSLPAGTYILSIRSQDGRYKMAQKFVKY